MSQPITLLLVGATGLVGSHVLTRALADPLVKKVIAPARRNLFEHPKLFSPIVDFHHLSADESWWEADAVICTLGTTMKMAGSKKAFRRVDYDFPLAVARMCLNKGASAFVLNSAIGANSASLFFYNRTKGELENALKKMNYSSLTLVRPAVISGEREQKRLGERLLIAGLKLSSPFLPSRWHLNPAQIIAKSLVEASTGMAPGIHVVPSSNLIQPKN